MPIMNFWMKHGRPSMSYLREVRPQARLRTLQLFCTRAFLVLSVMYPIIGESATDLDDLKLKGKKMAAIRAASESISSIPHLTSQDFSESATEEIVKDYQTHQDVASSQQIIRRRLQKRLRDEISSNLLTIYDQMRVSSEQYSKKQFLADIDNAYGQKIKDGITANVRRQFSDVFTNIRLSAVERQYRSIELSIYPTQEEVALADKDGWKIGRIGLGNSLRLKMQGKVSTLLEENVLKVKQAADQVIQDIDLQRKKQKATIESEGELNAFSIEGIRAELESKVKKVLAKDRKNRPVNKPVYDIFPSIRQRIGKEASEREARKFEDYISRQKVSIDKAELQQLIEANRQKHTRFDSSFQESTEVYLVKAKAAILESYSQKALNIAMGAEFKKRIKAFLRNQHYEQVVADSVRKHLRGPLQDVRERLSEKEVKENFAPVATKEWEVSEDVRPDDWSRLEAVGTFDEVRTLPGITTKNVHVEYSLILDETKETVQKAIPVFVSEGKKVWAAQQAIVDRLEKTILTDINNALGQKLIDHKMTSKVGNLNFNKKTEEKFVKQYRDLAKNTWSQERPTKNKYASLFPYVEEVIEKNVHNAFDVIWQNRLNESQEKKNAGGRHVGAMSKAASQDAEEQYAKDQKGLQGQRREELLRLEKKYKEVLKNMEISQTPDVKLMEKEVQKVESQLKAIREEIRETEKQDQIAPLAVTDGNGGKGLPLANTLAKRPASALVLAQVSGDDSTTSAITPGPGSISEQSPGDGSAEVSLPSEEAIEDPLQVSMLTEPVDSLLWWKLIPVWILMLVILVFLSLLGSVIYLLSARRRSKGVLKLEPIRNDEDFEQLAKRLARMFNGSAKIQGKTASILTQNGEVHLEIRTT